MGAISLTRTTGGTVSNANANLNNNWTTIENLVNGALDASNLAADSVGSSEIAANAVTTAEILDAAVTLAKLASSSVDNSKVAAAAAIAYSKLALAGSIVNADIAAAAALAVSKLAAGADSRQFIGMVGGVPTWKNGPALLKNTTPVGTGAATIETDLQTVTISANALAVGDMVRIAAGGPMTGSAGASKIARLYFGGTEIAVANAGTATGHWSGMAHVLVTGASAEEATALLFATYARAVSARNSAVQTKALRLIPSGCSTSRFM